MMPSRKDILRTIRIINKGVKPVVYNPRQSGFAEAVVEVLKAWERPMIASEIMIELKAMGRNANRSSSIVTQLNQSLGKGLFMKYKTLSVCYWGLPEWFEGSKLKKEWIFKIKP